MEHRRYLAMLAALDWQPALPSLRRLQPQPQECLLVRLALQQPALQQPAQRPQMTLALLGLMELLGRDLTLARLDAARKSHEAWKAMQPES